MKSLRCATTSTTASRCPVNNLYEQGRTYEKDGYFAKWRAIRDDKGRVIVAFCHNMHLGDA